MRWVLRFIMLCFSTISNLKSKKILRKKQRFSEKSIHNFTDSNYESNYRRSTWKTLEASLLFVHFCKTFDSLHFHFNWQASKISNRFYIPHLLKVILIYAKRRRGLLSISYRSYGLFPNCCCVSITEWMQRMNADWTHREKDWWELQKNAMWYFEQILEAMPYKKAAVWPLTFDLRKHPRRSKHMGDYWRSKDEFISEVLL